MATTLRVGAYVRFRPGSKPYELGLRRGVVISLTTPVEEHARKTAEGMERAGLSEDNAIRRGLYRREYPRGLNLPIVRAEPAGILEAPFDLPCHESFFEVIDPTGPAGVN
jgi:hypothetical protein